MFQELQEVGRFVKDKILSGSSIVASEESVGIVVIILGVIFVVSTALFYFQIFMKKQSIKFLLKEVCKSKNRIEFAKNYHDFQIIMKIKDEKSRLNPYDRFVRRAWAEYSETLVILDLDELDSAEATNPVRNTARPNLFFNSFDLGFEHGIWRHVPGIFVSVGLLLTFLGIIAAINGLRTFDDEAMRIFLDAAKSKFIMSLTGLAASILFTFVYRIQTAALDKKLANLCDEIEIRVLFHTLEQIAAEQLETLREQTGQLKVLGNDLGAQIGETISTVLSRDLAPVLDKVGNSAGSEVSGMVNQIGDALNAKLNESLDEMSITLSTINRTLVDVTDRLTSSGQNIGDEMSKGIANLNAAVSGARQQLEEDQAAAGKQRTAEQEASQKAISTLLESIEQNTRDNNANMNEAATNIASAAEGLSHAINGASAQVSMKAGEAVAGIGSDVNKKVADAGADITRQLADISEDFIDGLSDFQSKLDGSLVEPIRSMATNLHSSNQELEKHAAAINQVSLSQEKAATSLINSSARLEQVSRPISDSVEQIERINNAIRSSLEGSLSMMEASRASVDQTMSLMQTSIEEMRETIEDTENLDEKLGAAFEEISAGLINSQDQIRRFSEEITNRFGEGISSIQTVLDGISEFEPARQGD
ncbi:hypothetical protein N9747_05995 [Planktomarina sp.]|nr:hypothetical protein [Planktomarina sp.]